MSMFETKAEYVDAINVLFNGVIYDVSESRINEEVMHLTDQMIIELSKPSGILASKGFDIIYNSVANLGPKGYLVSEIATLNLTKLFQCAFDEAVKADKLEKAAEILVSATEFGISVKESISQGELPKKAVAKNAVTTLIGEFLSINRSQVKKIFTEWTQQLTGNRRFLVGLNAARLKYRSPIELALAGL